jgi:uncharacterized protein (TIGR02246 family)
MNSEVDELLRRMMQFWEHHDMDGFGALFSGDADFVNIFGDWLKGRDAIARDHAERHQTMFRTSRLAIEPPTVRALRQDIALVHWRWTMHDVRGPDGNVLGNKTGLMLQVMERGSEGWRIVASHNTETGRR